MKKKHYWAIGIIVLIIIIVAVSIYSYYISPYDYYSRKEREESCIKSGGNIKTISCCDTRYAANTSEVGIIGINFVDTCREYNLTSECSDCSTANINFQLKFCDCGEGKCQDYEGNCIIRPEVYALPV